MLYIIVALVLGLFILAAWYFLSALWLIVLGAVMAITLGIYTFRRGRYIWRNWDRMKVAEGRRKAFEADLEEGIRQHKKLFPKPKEMDPNGIEFL